MLQISGNNNYFIFNEAGYFIFFTAWCKVKVSEKAINLFKVYPVVSKLNDYTTTEELLKATKFDEYDFDEFYQNYKKLQVAKEEDEWKVIEEVIPLLYDKLTGEELNTIGVIAYRKQAYQKAIGFFKSALRRSSISDKNVLYNIASCYGIQGEEELAMYWFKKAVDEGFSYLTRARKDQNLKILHEKEEFLKIVGFDIDSNLTKQEGWIQDLDRLFYLINKFGYNPYRRYSKQYLKNQVEQAKNQITEINYEEFLLKVVKIMTLVGDGHSSVRFEQIEEVVEHIAPFQFMVLDGKVIVTATEEEFKDLLGAELLSINEYEIHTVLDKIREITHYDNLWDQIHKMCRFLTLPLLLKSLKIIGKQTRYSMQFLPYKSKARVSVNLTKSNFHKGEEENYFQNKPQIAHKSFRSWYNQFKIFHIEIIEGTRILHFQLNKIRNPENTPLIKLLNEIFEITQKNNIQTLAIDLRWNGGGNTNLIYNFVYKIISSPFNKYGKLFVLTSRKTYSAAQNLSTFLEKMTNAIFVGEPTGSSPNFIGETVFHTLAYSGIVVSISDRYWQSSHGNDTRSTIEPSITAPLTTKSLMEGEDIALKAIEKFNLQY